MRNFERRRADDDGHSGLSPCQSSTNHQTEERPPRFSSFYGEKATRDQLIGYPFDRDSFLTRQFNALTLLYSRMRKPFFCNCTNQPNEKYIILLILLEKIIFHLKASCHISNLLAQDQCFYLNLQKLYETEATTKQNYNGDSAWNFDQLLSNIFCHRFTFRLFVE